EMPETQGRSYLYFWPGGQTERAAIQLLKGSPTLTPNDRDVMTILVSPLTGKATIKWGRVPRPRPRDDVSESERIDATVFPCERADSRSSRSWSRLRSWGSGSRRSCRLKRARSRPRVTRAT